MTEEMKKRIEEASRAFDNLDFRNAVRSDCFKAGAKFILMLPELREIREVLEWYATNSEGPYTDAGMWRRAVYALEKLKALGIVNG